MIKENPWEQKTARPDHLPQSEAEWFLTGKFSEDLIKIGENQIRCAFAEGKKGGGLVTMAGGIPRDPERRRKLPLINKLYGYLAIKLLDGGGSSVLYNQPATGSSTGDWDKETVHSRTIVLADVTKTYAERSANSEISLIGTSAAGYMAAGAIDMLAAKGIRVSKLALLSPAAYPENAENIPYGEEFTDLLRSDWEISSSPIFRQLEKYLKDGGTVLITFFEADDPPIPQKIQDNFRTFAERLANAGCNITFTTIPGVAHNFRRIGSAEGGNVVDNDSVRKTAFLLKDFLAISS